MQAVVWFKAKTNDKQADDSQANLAISTTLLK
jgi:hypothetical protein